MKSKSISQTELFADAMPTKNFFLEMFTRDISLEACILDLIDNSIDALVRTKRIDVSDHLLSTPLGHRKKNHRDFYANLSIQTDKVVIEDNCGGIPLDFAQSDVFRFGHTRLLPSSRLGVYGVGLKRALFKIGNVIEIRSNTLKDGFRVTLNVNDWAGKEEWKIPLMEGDPAQQADTAGTVITITDLRPEVKSRIKSPLFKNELFRMIGQTYSQFLCHYIRVNLDGIDVTPTPIPVGSSGLITPGEDRFFFDAGQSKVSVTLSASLIARDEWRTETAGWYVLCNGRVVLRADKTDLTGWGAGKSLPSFHSKYNGFVGIAYFFSEDPHLLPWTTTKQGINRESLVYQQAKDRMVLLTKPITSWLNRMYPSDLEESPAEREIVKNIRPAVPRDILTNKNRTFSVVRGARSDHSMVKVRYDANRRDIDRIRKRLDKHDMTVAEVGLHTLNYFLRRECD